MGFVSCVRGALTYAGVEVNVIRGWLGHAGLITTNRYAEISAKTKEAALRACQPPIEASSGFRRSAAWRERSNAAQLAEFMLNIMCPFLPFHLHAPQFVLFPGGNVIVKGTEVRQLESCGEEDPAWVPPRGDRALHRVPLALALPERVLHARGRARSGCCSRSGARSHSGGKRFRHGQS
jgi:hypothetical protein